MYDNTDGYDGYRDQPKLSADYGRSEAIASQMPGKPKSNDLDELNERNRALTAFANDLAYRAENLGDRLYGAQDEKAEDIGGCHPTPPGAFSAAMGIASDLDRALNRLSIALARVERI